MRPRMKTMTLIKMCIKCNRKYTHDSSGYRHTEKCICGNSLSMRWVDLNGRGTRYINN